MHSFWMPCHQIVLIYTYPPSWSTGRWVDYLVDSMPPMRVWYLYISFFQVPVQAATVICKDRNTFPAQDLVNYVVANETRYEVAATNEKMRAILSKSGTLDWLMSEYLSARCAPREAMTFVCCCVLFIRYCMYKWGSIQPSKAIERYWQRYEW